MKIDVVQHLVGKKDYVELTEIPFCKECKFGSMNKSVMTENPIMRCAIFRTMTEPNGFCYKGERNEEEVR